MLDEVKVKVNALKKKTSELHLILKIEDKKK